MLLKNILKQTCLSCMVLVLLAGGYLRAQEITLVYPEVRPPFSTIINEIIRGIDDEIQHDIPRLKVGSGVSKSSVKNWIDEQDAKVTIVLGNQSFNTLASVNTPTNILLGAVLHRPDSIGQLKKQPYIISYTPSPELLFNMLKQLSPSIKNVHVIYNKSLNQWLIDIAKTAAREQGLTLVAHASNSIKESVNIYETIFNSIDGKSASVWLMQDSYSIDSQVILPRILKYAWDKNVILFSSSLAHVDKGALFNLFPDNKNLGRTLAKVAKKISTNSYHAPELIPLSDLKSAINVRTASHLGINLINEEKFDLIFPESAR